jgi:hypothetical protein
VVGGVGSVEGLYINVKEVIPAAVEEGGALLLLTYQALANRGSYTYDFDLRVMNVETGRFGLLGNPDVEGEKARWQAGSTSWWEGQDGRLRLGVARGRKGVEVWDLGVAARAKPGEAVALRAATKTG